MKQLIDFVLGIWRWLNGKKLFLVALIAGIPVIAQAAYDIVCALYDGSCPASAGQILLVSSFVVAILHRVLKILGLAEMEEK